MSTARNAYTITPHATNALTPAVDFIQCGGAGTVVFRPYGATADVTATVPAGGHVFCKMTHIRATSTATLIVGFTY